MFKATYTLTLLTVLCLGAACASPPKEDQRVAELQKELEAVKQKAAADQKAVAEQIADQKSAVEQKAAAAQNAVAAHERGRDANRRKMNEKLRRELEDMKPREFTLPVGTVIAVRTTAELSTKSVKNGSVFEALLERDLRLDGTTLAKSGSRVTCVVVVERSGRARERRGEPVGGGKSIAGVDANTLDRDDRSATSVDANNTKKKDVARTGIATGAGAMIGGIAGGGKGAAIGAGVGAAAGVGGTLATRGAAAVIPTETLIEFRLTAPATIVLRK